MESDFSRSVSRHYLDPSALRGVSHFSALHGPSQHFTYTRQRPSPYVTLLKFVKNFLSQITAEW